MPAPIRSLALLAALALATSARADWTLLTADLAKHPHLTIDALNATDGLTFHSDSSKLLHADTRDIVSLTAGRLPASDTALFRWKLALRNGDVLFGEPDKISGQSLVFRVSEIGPVTIPLKQVALLTSPKANNAPPTVAAADKDVVRLANNDVREGIVVGIDAAKIQIVLAGADDPTDIPRDSVASIALGGAAPPRALPPLSVRLNLTSGSVLTIPLSAERAFNWTLSTVKFKDSANHDLSVDADRIASLDIVGGRLVYLAELDPASEEQVSFLGTHWPMQVNKNVLGTPLRANKITFDHGIGVHTQSTLVYDLDGSFDTLSLKVALDDSAAPHGQAKASIILDGKTLWSSETLKPGQVSPELNLPIAGGKRLELHADPTSHLDVLGRLDWLDIALRRK